ncbi:translocation and assembly module lipoprotein TamL [Epilithonimonas tenax]|uniref:translocation and assembly module lipoprotein TamL n=1 Tax=Epilithonimonas tenax TaxID=191577 RepID=UPI0004831437|nr:BamA/TamA family outer membrane protein [Epilithonimonas tenax]
MSRKHINKYFQKYHIFCYAAILTVILYACNVTKKVPEGEYLLTKNKFQYTDGKVLGDELPDMVAQKPNKKTLLIAPLGLIFYNAANPKYDTILKEYMTYPSEMRNQKLRDSLFVKYNHQDYVGKNLFWNRFFHTVGQPPVIFSDAKTKQSVKSINNRLINRGYWDAEVKTNVDKDSAAKKAEVEYIITHKDPTKIKEYYYNIPDPNVRALYESRLDKSLVRKGQILDETVLEKEITRINDLAKDAGYYKFNNDNQDIYFVADSLQSRKDVPLTMAIHKDSADTPYRKATIGTVKVSVARNINDTRLPLKDSIRGINIYRKDSAYTANSLWLPITIKPGDLYRQSNLDLSRRNLITMNNFTILKASDELRKEGTAAERDSIIDVEYILKPLPKYEFNIATDIHYSQILNFGFSPSVDLTTRNIFGGAENLITSFSGIIGTTKDPKDPNAFFNAYELSAQAALQFPRLLVPFRNYWKLIPKRYSPTTSINLGASVQNNIGLGRINFNTGLSFNANVNDGRVQHRLTLFNTQLSLTQNKDGYYNYFPADNEIRKNIFDLYRVDHPEINDISSYDDISALILSDTAFITTLANSDRNLLFNYLQSIYNKERQTQDVIISSIIYNFTYNEIGKKDYKNPFSFTGKVEIAGNFLNMVTKKEENYLVYGNTKTIFNIPFSQFIKFDLDYRKYFTFFNDRAKPHTLAFRQFIGIGIPYGNSTEMPFVRSYFNGGAYDIRAWVAFGGLGPADSQLDERVRSYAMDNVKLTTSIEYRLPLTDTFEAALFTDVGNIWGLKDNGFGDQFKFKKFISQMGVGSGFGIRMNIAYVNLRLDMAYKMYNPNRPEGERWVIGKIQPLKPTVNFAIGYPF